MAFKDPKNLARETPPREAARARRTPEPTSEIDGIIKAVAGNKTSGDSAISALVERLERRVYMIERDLAEEAEKASKEKNREAVFTQSEFEQFAARIDTLEERLAEIFEKKLSAEINPSDRPRILQPAPPAGPGVAQDIPGAREAAMASVKNSQNEEGNNSSSGNNREPDERLETFLSAGFEAVNPAAWHAEPSDSDEVDSRIGSLKRMAQGLRVDGTRLDKKTLLTRVALVPIMLAGLALTTWTAMGTGEELESVPLAVSAAALGTAPGTVIALEMNSARQPTLLRLEAIMAAADAGDVDAQTVLGLNYLNGEGVAVDVDEALRWLHLASENGDAVAQYSLATIYARPDSAISDPVAAKFWFQSAAEQGNRMAMNNLAMFYAQGLGTDQDTTEAAHWFAMAAALGFKVAQFNLAVLYERGDGVPQDNVEAYRWYAIAAAQGDQDAAARAAFLAENMSPDALLAVRNEVSSFDPATMDPEVNNPPQFSSSTG